MKNTNLNDEIRKIDNDENLDDYDRSYMKFQKILANDPNSIAAYDPEIDGDLDVSQFDHNLGLNDDEHTILPSSIKHGQQINGTTPLDVQNRMKVLQEQQLDQQKRQLEALQRKQQLELEQQLEALQKQKQLELEALQKQKQLELEALQKQQLEQQQQELEALQQQQQQELDNLQQEACHIKHYNSNCKDYGRFADGSESEFDDEGFFIAYDRPDTEEYHKRPKYSGSITDTIDYQRYDPEIDGNMDQSMFRDPPKSSGQKSNLAIDDKYPFKYAKKALLKHIDLEFVFDHPNIFNAEYSNQALNYPTPDEVARANKDVDNDYHDAEDCPPPKQFYDLRKLASEIRKHFISNFTLGYSYDQLTSYTSLKNFINKGEHSDVHKLQLRYFKKLEHDQIDDQIIISAKDAILETAENFGSGFNSRFPSFIEERVFQKFGWVRKKANYMPSAKWSLTGNFLMYITISPGLVLDSFKKYFELLPEDGSSISEEEASELLAKTFKKHCKYDDLYCAHGCGRNNVQPGKESNPDHPNYKHYDKADRQPTDQSVILFPLVVTGKDVNLIKRYNEYAQHIRGEVQIVNAEHLRPDLFDHRKFKLTNFLRNTSSADFNIKAIKHQKLPQEFVRSFVKKLSVKDLIGENYEYIRFNAITINFDANISGYQDLIEKTCESMKMDNYELWVGSSFSRLHFGLKSNSFSAGSIRDLKNAIVKRFRTTSKTISKKHFGGTKYSTKLRGAIVDDINKFKIIQPLESSYRHLEYKYEVSKCIVSKIIFVKGIHFKLQIDQESRDLKDLTIKFKRFAKNHPVFHDDMTELAPDGSTKIRKNAKLMDDLNIDTLAVIKNFRTATQPAYSHISDQTFFDIAKPFPMFDCHAEYIINSDTDNKQSPQPKLNYNDFRKYFIYMQSKITADKTKFLNDKFLSFECDQRRLDPKYRYNEGWDQIKFGDGAVKEHISKMDNFLIEFKATHGYNYNDGANPENIITQFYNDNTTQDILDQQNVEDLDMRYFKSNIKNEYAKQQQFTRNLYGFAYPKMQKQLLDGGQLIRKFGIITKDQDISILKTSHHKSHTPASYVPMEDDLVDESIRRIKPIDINLYLNHFKDAEVAINPFYVSKDQISDKRSQYTPVSEEKIQQYTPPKSPESIAFQKSIAKESDAIDTTTEAYKRNVKLMEIHGQMCQRKTPADIVEDIFEYTRKTGANPRGLSVDARWEIFRTNCTKIKLIRKLRSYDYTLTTAEKMKCLELGIDKDTTEPEMHDGIK